MREGRGWNDGGRCVAVLLVTALSAGVAQAAAPFAPSAVAHSAVAAVALQDAAASPDGRRATHADPPLYRVLVPLRGDAYRARLDELADERPGEVLNACVLRAGRAAPPVVTTSRRTEREGMQADALLWLKDRLNGPERDAWVAHLRALLRNPAAGARGNVRNAEELWSATARTIGKLGLEQLAEELALSLDDTRPVRRASARAALFDLHLSWYEDLAEFMDRRGDGGALCDDPRYYEELRAQIDLSRSRLGELLRLDPERAFLALSDDDPAVRVDAARALGRGATDGRIDREAAFQQLIDAARHEVDAKSFHAALEALLAMQAGAAPDALDVGRLRLLIRELILDGHPPLQASVSQACSRLPVAFTVESKDARVHQVLFMLDDQLASLVAQDGLVDDDAMLACLRAALNLCDRARAAGVTFGDEMKGLREHLYDVLEWNESFREVRQAAAQVLARLTRPEDLGELSARMEARREDSELVFGMIGPLADAAAAAEPSDEGAQRALDLLVSWCSHPDVDLRGRAIASVADPRLAELAHGIDAKGFIDQLALESVPDLQRALLGLLERHGTAADVRRILDLPNFDTLIVGNPALVASIVRTLGVLAGGDHELQFASAERLLAVDEPATRVRRLIDAIRLMAALSSEEAQMLAREQHAAVVHWAMELRAAGGGLVAWDEPQTCAAFLQRLTQLHVPRSLQPGAQPTGADEHRLALLLSDLDAVLPGSVAPEEILGHFERALADAADNPDSNVERAVVLRDRARFHLENEKPSLARNDYRALLELDGGETSALLDLRDLRAAGEVIERVPADPSAPTDSERQAAREAYAVSRQLVARPAWTSETAGLRLADLVDLAERARWSKDGSVLADALAVFAALPEADDETPPQPLEGSAWAGLAADPARLAKLVVERDELRAAQRAIPATPPGPPTTPDDQTAEIRPADGEEGDAELPDDDPATPPPDRIAPPPQPEDGVPEPSSPSSGRNA